MVNVNKDTFRSIIVAGEDGDIRVDEGNVVKFTVESTGEAKSGTVTKVSGKGEKAKLQIIPVGFEHEEVWSVIAMEEDSLQVIK